MERLDKLVTYTGVTRSQARKLIAAGKVTVDGTPCRDIAKHAEAASVRLNGEPIVAPGELYIMLNKPAGVVTATEDRHLPTVLSLLPDAWQRQKPGPVGRLDRDVTGLVLLTTDGELAHRLISPKWKADKRYRAVCEGKLTEHDVEAFASGLTLSDFTAMPATLVPLNVTEERSEADVILHEGKFHQVKRMFAAVGHPLIALKRLQIGGVILDETLAEGESRPLTDEEIHGLKVQVRLEEA